MKSFGRLFERSLSSKSGKNARGLENLFSGGDSFSDAIDGKDINTSSGRERVEEVRTTISDGSGKSKKKVVYTAKTIAGTGSFGIVYKAVDEEGTTVAIKKVLQDRRYKNRELEITRLLSHKNVIVLKGYFYTKSQNQSDPKKQEVYLNLIMDFLPECLYNIIRTQYRHRATLDKLSIKLYMYQLCRAVAYVHSLGICHRDIKPQNVLLDASQTVRLCDFGSAKFLTKGEPNVAYICSRYYRAPELIFESTKYSFAIDSWSIGCVFAECMKGQPLFRGNSSIGQLGEIVRIVGSPAKEDIWAMNPHAADIPIPKGLPSQLRNYVNTEKFGEEALDLLSKFFIYSPTNRITPFKALAHPFFDELRNSSKSLPKHVYKGLIDFSDEEIEQAMNLKILDRLMPKTE